jgi:hypothetical protein
MVSKLGFEIDLDRGREKIEGRKMNLDSTEIPRTNPYPKERISPPIEKKSEWEAYLGSPNQMTPPPCGQS